MSKKTSTERFLFSRQSFKMAVATRHVTDCAQSFGLRPLSELELRSVYALFAWVANQQHTAEETVQSITETHFGVNHITGLKQKDYEEVIRFLVDVRMDELTH